MRVSPVQRRQTREPLALQGETILRSSRVVLRKSAALEFEENEQHRVNEGVIEGYLSISHRPNPKRRA